MSEHWSADDQLAASEHKQTSLMLDENIIERSGSSDMTRLDSKGATFTSETCSPDE